METFSSVTGYRVLEICTTSMNCVVHVVDLSTMTILKSYIVNDDKTT